MDYSDFRNLAIRSANIYWNYLNDHGKGISATKVSRITREGNTVYLHLLGRLSPAGTDSAQLQIYANRYSTEMIKPVEYQSEEGILVLKPRKDILRILPMGNCENVAVISDLLFLVARVGRWYEMNPGPFGLPALPPTVSPPSFEKMAGGTPSAEQYSTVQGVLSSSFSYVWGAPGTGKTRYVLANCVLSYLREDRKVILVAPTNNALEQMLSGVLEVLFSENISPDCVRRLGIPSKGFASRYPSVCEHRSVEARRAVLSRQIEGLQNKLGSAKKLLITEAALSAFSALNDSLSAAADTLQESSISCSYVSSLKESVKNLEAQIVSLDRQINAESIWRQSFPGRLCRFFLPAKYSLRASEADATIRKRADAAQRVSSYQLEIEECNTKSSNATRIYQETLCALHQQFIEHCRTFNELDPLPDHTVSPADLPAYLPQLLSQINSCRRTLPTVPEDVDLDRLSSNLHTYENALSRLEEDEESNWSDVRVLAMTIDRYIGMYSTSIHQDFSPEHIFMDEAAYCSLIKGCILFGAGCPLTLFGDHAQLPPVCEMSDADFKSDTVRPVFLFSQSAIHMESALSKTYSELYQDYVDAEPPAFHNLHCYALPVTYRFGPNLAAVLSEYIYTHGLRSARAAQLSIRFIDARSSPQDPARTSSTECRAIAGLSQKLSAERRDFAILTPYKSQAALLSKRIKSADTSGQIMTVHASQGREFDTIILSVVDTSRKYYVNSSISVGKSVINTAVSRAKNQLILVLDADYWYTQKNQMIGHLLHIASPYRFEDDPSLSVKQHHMQPPRINGPPANFSPTGKANLQSL